MRAYLVEEAASLKKRGLDIEKLKAGVRETPASAKILANFSRGICG
jgi:hypothetical protein